MDLSRLEPCFWMNILKTLNLLKTLSLNCGGKSSISLGIHIFFIKTFFGFLSGFLQSIGRYGTYSVDEYA